MKVRVTSSIDVGSMLSKRGLGDSSDARKYLAARIKVRSDPYVPFRSGTLKNTAQITDEGRRLVYPQPYAHYQYHGLVMGPNVLTKNGWISLAGKGGKRYTGKSLKYHGGAMRGPKWDKRMMEAHRADIERDLEAFIASKGG